MTCRGQKSALSRSRALTYANVKTMYNDVYNSLVQAGVAKKSNDFSFDHDGPLNTTFHLHIWRCVLWWMMLGVISVRREMGTY